MYETAAIVAAIFLVYTAFSGRVERSWLSGPVVFTAAGVLLGPAVLGIMNIQLEAKEVRLLAEGTLALVLFTDAANADFAVVRRNVTLPLRLLLVGLPLTIILGFLAALAVFPGLDVLAAALIATILAPTDAALGKPVVTDHRVSSEIREALNVESGLNDGICVPVVLILIELAVGTEVEGVTAASVLTVVAEELGIGLVVGIAVTGLATLLLRRTVKRDWVAESWVQVPAVAAGVLCFAGAQEIGGSGFIACFVGGLTMSWLAPLRKHELLRTAESIGETLAMMTWLAFGAVSVGQMFGRLNFSVLAYSVLSLTLVRMLPVFLCLAGSGMGSAQKLFIGWFGPRGLASIVFGVIVFNEKLAANDTLETVVVCTVLLSVIAHGMTANPLLSAFRSNPASPRQARLGETVAEHRESAHTRRSFARPGE